MEVAGPLGTPLGLAQRKRASPRGDPSVEPGVSGDFWGSQEGCQGPFRPSGRNRGLPLRRLLGLDQGEEELPGLLPCVRDNMEPLLE